MREILSLAWQRFSIISAVVSDANARAVATIFYFTIFVPFGLISILGSDPLRRKDAPRWLDREPVPTDIASAKEQG